MANKKAVLLSQKSTRLQVELTPYENEKLARVLELTDARTKVDVLTKALRLYAIVVEETAKGNELILRHPDGETLSVLMVI